MLPSDSCTQTPVLSQDEASFFKVPLVALWNIPEHCEMVE